MKRKIDVHKIRVNTFLWKSDELLTFLEMFCVYFDTEKNLKLFYINPFVLHSPES